MNRPRKANEQRGKQRTAALDVRTSRRLSPADGAESELPAQRESEGHAEMATPNGSDRDERGQFRKGHPGPALTHSAYSDLHLPPGLEGLEAEVDQFIAQQLADDGEDLEHLPARRAKLTSYRSRIVHKNIIKLAYALEQRGLVDKRGKLRVAWIEQLGRLIDRAMRLDSMLGLDRKQKRVNNETPAEWLARQPIREP